MSTDEREARTVEKAFYNPAYVEELRVALEEARAERDAARYFIPDDYEDKNPEWRTCKCSACRMYRRALSSEPTAGEPVAVEKDDEGRPYQCGAFVSGDPRWECRLESDHPGEHEWRLADRHPHPGRGEDDAS